MTEPDTSIVGGQDHFPSTVWEDLGRVGDRDVFNDLVTLYWRPVYHYVRVVWKKSSEDAKDLTQEFFTTIFDPAFVAKVNPERGSFRGFVITSLKNFLANQEKARKRIKRGGGAAVLSLDFRTADEEAYPLPASDAETPEEYFDRVWARNVLDQAVGTLKQTYARENRSDAFEAFRLYCLNAEDGLSYRDISLQLKVSEKDVDNFIYAARKEFRRIVADTVRQYISDPALLEEELRRLFGSES